MHSGLQRQRSHGGSQRSSELSSSEWNVIGDDTLIRTLCIAHVVVGDDTIISSLFLAKNCAVRFA